MSIYSLSQLAALSAADQVPIYSASNGVDGRISLTALLAFIASQQAAAGGFVPQYLAPNASGFSATIGGPGKWLVLTPAAPYAAATITLPTGLDGGEVLISTTQAVTTLTLAGGTVYGAPAGLAATAALRLRYDGITGAWFRI